MTQEPRDRHPALKGWPVGSWCPTAVGKVRGYPRTLATYERQRARLRANREHARDNGTLTRLGVPNGWAGKREEIANIRRNSQTEAEMLVEEMERTGYWRADCVESRVVMTELMKMVVSEIYTVRIRMSAMRLVLTYTQARPTHRVTLAAAGGAFGLAEAWAAEGARLAEQGS